MKNRIEINNISINDIQQQGIAALSNALSSVQQTGVLDLFAQAGTRLREDIDAAFKAEREDWDKK